MKNKFFFNLALLFFVSISNGFFSQQNLLEKLANNDFPQENMIVDFSMLSQDSLNIITEKLLKESYFSCPNYIQSYFDLSKNFMSRVKIIRFNDEEIANIKNISGIDIKNKCNSNLSHSNYLNFNLLIFNPLIYRIDLLKEEDQVFRLYNSNLIMYIVKK